MARVPVVRGAARILNQIALDSQVARAAFGVDRAVRAALVPIRPWPAYPAPECEMTVFDDVVMASRFDYKGMNRGVTEFDTANDDIIGIDHAGVIFGIPHVNRGFRIFCRCD